MKYRRESICKEKRFIYLFSSQFWRHDICTGLVLVRTSWRMVDANEKTIFQQSYPKQRSKETGLEEPGLLLLKQSLCQNYQSVA
jgi:hypothetical protein